MVEFPVGQPRELPRGPQERHDRLGVEGEAVQTIAVAWSGDPVSQVLDLLGGKYAMYESPKRADPHYAARGEAFASADTSGDPSLCVSP